MDYSTALIKGTQVMLHHGAHTLRAEIENRLFDYLFVRPLDEAAAALFAQETLAEMEWTAPPLRWVQSVKVQRQTHDPALLVIQLVGMPRPIERRRARRLPVSWRVQVRWGRWPGQSVQGITQDVSATGTRCQFPRALPEGTALSLFLQGPERTWHCLATVLRQSEAEPGRWVTILLWEDTPETRQFQNWIHQQAE
ncbi:MAG: PilZ domain-containing protein [Firmicutes bacterium]|nr:PilZ domain-containing protein [Bacillota bacterium]